MEVIYSLNELEQSRNAIRSTYCDAQDRIDEQHNTFLDHSKLFTVLWNFK